MVAEAAHRASLTRYALAPGGIEPAGANQSEGDIAIETLIVSEINSFASAFA
jgi:hypothetical protein